MPKNYSAETFDYICDLSKLAFTAQERLLVETYVDDMLNKLRLPDVKEMSVGMDNSVPMEKLREDEVTNPEVTKEMLQQFIVPRSI